MDWLESVMAEVMMMMMMMIMMMMMMMMMIMMMMRCPGSAPCGAWPVRTGTATSRPGTSWRSGSDWATPATRSGHHTWEMILLSPQLFVHLDVNE